MCRVNSARSHRSQRPPHNLRANAVDLDLLPSSPTDLPARSPSPIAVLALRVSFALDFFSIRRTLIHNTLIHVPRCLIPNLCYTLATFCSIFHCFVTGDRLLSFILRNIFRYWYSLWANTTPLFRKSCLSTSQPRFGHQSSYRYLLTKCPTAPSIFITEGADGLDYEIKIDARFAARGHMDANRFVFTLTSVASSSSKLYAGISATFSYNCTQLKGGQCPSNPLPHSSPPLQLTIASITSRYLHIPCHYLTDLSTVITPLTRSSIPPPLHLCYLPVSPLLVSLPRLPHSLHFNQLFHIMAEPR